MKHLLTVLLLTWSLASNASAKIDVSKLRFPVTKKVLPNGLTVLLYEDHSVPTVTYLTWFRVGSKDEEPGYTGIAHLFEHMMFKGGKRFPGTEFEKMLQGNGISNNAFTNYDYTGYYEDLPSSKLKLVIDFESDRLENLQITEENLKSEREVVKEERRWRVDNSINGILNEVLWSNAYKVHPYKWPVIGWMKDIDAIDLARCKKFFSTYYSAPNAVIVVSGDINQKQTLEWINNYYGHLPKVNIPRPPLAQEPPQTEERKVIVSRPAQAEHVVIGHHVTRQGEPDSFALDLLSNILTEGDSSRLYRRLVYHDQVAVGVSGGSLTPYDPGLFEIFVELKPGVSHEKVLPAIYDELKKIAAQKVKFQEIEKVRNQTMNHWVESMKTIHGKGQSLALNEVLTGSYANAFDDLAQYEKVTINDIQRVAQKYLTAQNRTVVVLVPEKGKKP
jgi:zinc protease